ncbi:hypothetical protein SAMN05444320_107229 [Streptoalloteichus hindustanus]|uniref:Uncharacterized protein n=2 Tax=Streptoalloteichus hindustanus TaxID=2017 RepID=A0A1M5ID13_STRHI|nr:hypothetical protein SAMN05444320_107229 [Streptoalloteichus hindustanus]
MALTTSTASATTVPPRPAPEQALIAASHTQTLYFGRTTSKNAEVHLKDMPDPKPIEVHPNPPDIGNHPSVPDTNNGNDHHSHGKHGESRFCRRHRWC